MIDREYLMSEADGFSVAEYLGMEMVKKGSNFCIHCPGHEKRLGRPDTRIGNAVLTNKGYHCYACGKSVNVIDMVMEYTGCSYPDALNTIADACGGVSLFESKTDNKNKQNERLPLSADDLILIGLSPSSYSMPIINASNTRVEPFDDTIIRAVGHQYFAYKKNCTSIVQLYRTDYNAYCELVKEKARHAVDVYQDAIDKFCSRDAKEAELIYNLFNENGYIDGNVFFKLKNAFQKKYWRAKEIFDAYNKK